MTSRKAQPLGDSISEVTAVKDNASVRSASKIGRKLWTISVFALLILAMEIFSPGATAREKAKLPPGPLICLWEHDAKVDIAPVVQELGFNTLWAHDPAYHGQDWTETMMYKALEIPGMKYVLGKVDRKQWGWSYEDSLKHAEWIAKLSLEHPQIIGLYLNDYFGEVEEGGKTKEQWAEIIARAKAINPKLPIWAPLYPDNGDLETSYDFGHDALIFNIWDDREVRNGEKWLTEAEKKFPDTPIVTGLYLNSGRSKEESWLSEDDFKYLLGVYVNHLNAGKTAGLRIYRAEQFSERPEYLKWAKEVLAGLKKPAL